MRLAGTRWAALAVPLSAALALLAWLVTLQHAVGPARVVAGLLLVFVLPGVAATAALFPELAVPEPGRAANERPRLSRLERVVLVPTLSLAVPVIGGVLLNLVGLRLTAATWGGLGAVATLLLAGVAYLRQRGSRSPSDPFAPAGGSARPAAFPPGAAGSGRPGRPAVGMLRRLAPLAVAVALLGIAGWIGMRSATNGAQESFTALSMVPDDDPNPADQVRPVTLAVDCHESAPTRYTVKVREDAGDGHQYQLSLQPGEVWKQDLDVPTTGRVTADLFKGDGDTPYRSVFVSGLQ
ncbi:DUF1616 domain-containing protein [Rugosimonospora africana]|uniref:DUF1616 domain-containing protein n=1 Tax=Rugosimonospora africana TaxID=556532 RepID=A0A8J3QPI9_9ACTN|nr:DUF1616 domain-containing protein [Rugosimonospora africana]GIH13862.1 hypothetical protein Raf01_20340 [Rugosimonospora africana]